MYWGGVGWRRTCTVSVYLGGREERAEESLFRFSRSTRSTHDFIYAFDLLCSVGRVCSGIVSVCTFETYIYWFLVLL